MENKQTPVEWLVDKIKSKYSDIDFYHIKKEIEQAKEMEKEQIINSYNEGYGIRDAYGDCSDNQTAEQYYKELYNK